MTREEAIQVLQTALTAPFIYGEYEDAIGMAIEALLAEQDKLNNPCDSLIKDDSGGCKEQKSKLESAEEAKKIDHDRDWIIGCIEHDGFIHTHRFDKANQIIHDALSAEAEWIPVSDIRRLQDILYLHIDSLEGTRNIVEAGMLSAWKEVAEYIDGMLGEDGEEE